MNVYKVLMESIGAGPILYGDYRVIRAGKDVTDLYSISLIHKSPRALPCLDIARFRHDWESGVLTLMLRPIGANHENDPVTTPPEFIWEVFLFPQARVQLDAPRGSRSAVSMVVGEVEQQWSRGSESGWSLIIVAGEYGAVFRLGWPSWDFGISQERIEAATHWTTLGSPWHLIETSILAEGILSFATLEKEQ